MSDQAERLPRRIGLTDTNPATERVWVAHLLAAGATGRATMLWRMTRQAQAAFWAQLAAQHPDLPPDELRVLGVRLQYGPALAAGYAAALAARR